VQDIILGGGITGLAAGYASGLSVYEATEQPGGICWSYYMRPGSSVRLAEMPADGEAYRFEIGGGHWIFGGDPAILAFIDSVAKCIPYVRKSSVFLPDKQLHIPYPLQNNLRYLDADLATHALVEMSRQSPQPLSMKQWLHNSFGPTLCNLFFDRFHQLYTAGLYDRIAPQDAYKSPVDFNLAIQGAFGGVAAVGYNVSFIYPLGGLDALARIISANCDVSYKKRAVRIDSSARLVVFDDGSAVKYDRLISTLPLATAMEIAGLKVDPGADPYSSVLVLNIGATRGPRCPDDHWVYVADSTSGFHRVGFYSAVDSHFLPASMRSGGDHVSIYVERAYLPNERPTKQQEKAYSQAVLQELIDFGYIAEADVIDATWIEVAYTWSWPNSKWKTVALRALQEHGIFQVGRYGRWTFQGIAESLRDGFVIGSSFRKSKD
jgi:protoporphyrinogen oxidase